MNNFENDVNASYKILAVIVTYNGSKWIEQCLQSLMESEYPVDIAVVDNASTDSTCSQVKSLSPNSKLFVSDRNLGFGKGNNIALRYALDQKYDFVFLLNQDACVNSKTIATLLRCHLINPSYGLLSPVHFNWEGTALEKGFIEFFREGINAAWFNDTLIGNPAPCYPVEFVNAAAWFIPRYILQKVGGFDPIFPHYGEDNDWIYRLSYHGYRAGICLGAQIYHASNYKTWEEISFNKQRVGIIYINAIKNMNGSFRSNLFLFAKKETDGAFTAILTGNWKKGIFMLKCILITLCRLPLIIKSRKESTKEKAFLY